MATYWTIQTLDKWKEVQKLGYLTGDRNYISEDFVGPYEWMMEQMKERLPKYRGEYPIWLWIERPDLRRSGHLAKNTQTVLLKIELEESDVLLSELQAWHIVLYHSFFYLEFEDEDRAYTEDEMRKSWTYIFEIETLKRYPDWGPDVTLQGVTGKIHLKQIQLKKTFIAR